MMDEVDLEVRFLETRVRGEDGFSCEVRVTENGLYGFQVHDSWFWNSWDEMMEVHPTFKSLVNEFFLSNNWEVVDGNHKVLTFSAIHGGDGLYEDYNIEVCSDEDFEL